MFTSLSPTLCRMRGMEDRGGKGRNSAVRGRGAAALAVAIAAAMATFVLAAPAAAAFGQIGEAWGKAGGATGQFTNPAMLGVDASDGSVYTGEEKSELSYRVQKFTAAGEFKASVEIPRKEGELTFKLH